MTGLRRSLLAGAALLAGPASAEMMFNRVASFATPANMAAGEDAKRVSSAEIVAATADGMTLVYTDSPLKVLGRIDLSDPAVPKPLGNVPLPGEPTSVTTLGPNAFVAVNTSESRANPSGRLLAIEIASGAERAACDLGGQPDSVAMADDGSFMAVAIENERDEDLNDGKIPQMPAGFVAILPVKDGLPDCAAMIRAEVTGLAAVAPEDPEPEFVDVNAAGEIVVTLQENNHVAILDRTGSVLSHFSAGAVDLQGIDRRRDGRMVFDQTQEGRLREPDAVKWLDADHVAMANEGDYEGGSRGWTIFRRDGTVVWESGASLEHAVIAHGHYPEHRSRSKGVEPEGIEVARFGDETLVFVALERASLVAVYRVAGGVPTLLQLLPSGISPEGLVAIPSRNLLVTANELDLVEDGLARSHVMVYARAEGPAAYPTIVSESATGPLGWTALSGLAADPATPGKLYAVSDSVLGLQPRIFTIDATQRPARIVSALDVTREGFPAQKLDIEGITPDGEGGFWLASEGRSDRLIPHALYHVNGKGEITGEVPFPEALLAAETRFGAEGIAKVGTTLWVAIQRPWKDDPKGMVKLLAWDTKAKEWGAVRYPLETAAEGWVGLSEITVHGDWAYIVERDNLIGSAAKLKALYRVKLADLKPAKLGGDLPVVAKELVRDFIPDLLTWKGYVQDKVEGFAIDAAGEGFVVTDNDGTDDHSGETHFWSVGKL